MKTSTFRLSRSLAMAAAGLVALASSARADAKPLTDAEAKKLFNQRSCNACHEVDEARIGPAYRTVGLRYKSRAGNSVDWLTAKILNGGSGSWGTVPMVSNPRLPPDEAKAMARWILDLGSKPGPAAKK